jgi:hypothetical protein
MNMDTIDELLESFRILSASLEKLRQLEGPEFLLPGSVDDYHRILEDAYAAYGTIETRVDELGQQLEAEHARLDQGVKKYG